MPTNANGWKSGRVLWFNLGKGMGLIRPNMPDEDDVRFDTSLVEEFIEHLRSDALVEYIAEDTLIGMCATNLRIKSDR